MTESSTSITEADRIALTNLFKQIAEYGRRVRQRRMADAPAEEQAVIPVLPEGVTNDPLDTA